jgi:hypothetical protein
VIVVAVQSKVEQNLQTVCILGAIVLPLSVYLALYGARLQAFQYITWSQLPQVVVRPLLFAVFVVIAAGMADGRISAPSAMVAQIASILACIFILLIGTGIVLPRDVLRGVSAYDKGLWLSVAAPFESD